MQLLLVGVIVWLLARDECGCHAPAAPGVPVLPGQFDHSVAEQTLPIGEAGCPKGFYC